MAAKAEAEIRAELDTMADQLAKANERIADLEAFMAKVKKVLAGELGAS